MSALAAAWSLYWRRTDLRLLALAGCAMGGSCALLARWLAPVLEPAQREGLILVGLASALVWVPGLVGGLLRSQVGDARERLLPSLAAHIQVALAALAGAYVLPLLAALLVMRVDPAFGIALGTLVGALTWWGCWRQGRSLALVLPCLVLVLPETAPWLRAALHGGHPVGAGLLLGAAALVAVAVAAATMSDVRSDRCRRPELRHRLAELPWWWPGSAPARIAVGRRTWPWVRHLGRGWRAEMAHPLALAPIAGLAAALLAWQRTGPLSAFPEASDGALLAFGIGLMLWMGSVGLLDSGAMVRADAVRPASRDRFATLLLLVVGRALVRTWAGLWAGALAGLWLASGPSAMAAAAPFALVNLATLPAFAGVTAGMVSARMSWVVWALVLALGFLPAAVLPLETVMRRQGSPAGLIGACVGLAVAGLAVCWMSHRRWRTVDLA